MTFDIVLASLPALTTLIAAFGGGFASHHFANKQKIAMERRSQNALKNAIAAEISMIVHFSARRKWLENIENTISRLSDEKTREAEISLRQANVEMQRILRRADGTEQLSRVYRATMDRVGDLGECASDVVRFHAEIEAFNTIEEVVFNQEFLEHHNIFDVISVLRAEKEVQENNFCLGKELINRLKALPE